MKTIITNRISSPTRSLCAGTGMMAVSAADPFRAAGIGRRPRIFNFSPVPIIRPFPAALSALAGWRNKSNQPHRNLTSTAGRWRPPGRAASRHGPLGWPKQFFLAEFVGLKRSRQRLLSGPNQSEAFQL
jgi:hypothetical protein